MLLWTLLYCTCCIHVYILSYTSFLSYIYLRVALLGYIIFICSTKWWSALVDTAKLFSKMVLLLVSITTRTTRSQVSIAPFCHRYLPCWSYMYIFFYFLLYLLFFFFYYADLFNLAILVGISLCLYLHFLDVHWDWSFSHVPVGHLNTILCDLPSYLLPNFLLGSLCFSYRYAGVQYIVFKQTLYWLYVLQLSLSMLWLTFLLP